MEKRQSTGRLKIYKPKHLIEEIILYLMKERNSSMRCFLLSKVMSEDFNLISLCSLLDFYWQLTA